MRAACRTVGAGGLRRWAWARGRHHHHHHGHRPEPAPGSRGGPGPPGAARGAATTTVGGRAGPTGRQAGRRADRGRGAAAVAQPAEEAAPDAAKMRIKAEPGVRREEAGGVGIKAAAASPHARPVLHDLGETLEGTLLRRPAEGNTSPYMADVEVWEGGRARKARAHVPFLGLGGLSVPGARLLMTRPKPPKTPPKEPRKTEFVVQLVQVREPECGPDGRCWIGAHPTLANLLVGRLLEMALLPGLGTYTGIQQEVTRETVWGRMRTDFVLTDPATDREVELEVKNVVCADYAPRTAPDRKVCVYINEEEPYARTGIFPWGAGRNQKFQGENVVSERALKHLLSLTAVARGGGEAAVVLLVNRGDCQRLRACYEACEVFSRALEDAMDAGVQVLTPKVCWEGGKAYYEGTGERPLGARVGWLVGAEGGASRGAPRRLRRLTHRPLSSPPSALRPAQQVRGRLPRGEVGVQQPALAAPGQGGGGGPGAPPPQPVARGGPEAVQVQHLPPARARPAQLPPAGGRGRGVTESRQFRLEWNTLFRG